MDKIHDCNPLEEAQKNILKEHGYSEEEIAQLDAGDFNKIEKKWTITSADIKRIKNIYKELADTDITKWTWGDVEKYSKDADKKKYAPSAGQAEELKDRGITPEDARVLLKDYHSYDEILNKSDEELKSAIEGYYDFKLKNIEEMNTLVQQQMAIVPLYASAPPTSLQGTTYRWVSNFPGYGADWFHQTAQSHVSAAIRTFQSDRTQEAYVRIYPTSNSFRATNLFGTWSRSQEGAHEGIDFTFTTNTPELKSFLPTPSIAIDAGSYKVALYSSQIYRSLIYYHLSQINVSPNSSVYYGQVIGRQGYQGGTSSGYHLHLEAGIGQDSTLDPTYKNHSLTSANIYDVIDMALHG